METVKVHTMVDVPISVNLYKFFIVHCVNVLDSEKHPGHLQSRKGSNMIS